MQFEHRQSERAGDAAHFAGDARVMAMELDAHEPVFLHRDADQLVNPAAVALGVNEREPIQAVRAARHHARDVAVRHPVIRVERREDDRAAYPGARSATQVTAERRRRVPGTRQSIAETRMAMAVDDHDAPR